jgi:hypothetical protein
MLEAHSPAAPLPDRSGRSSLQSRAGAWSCLPFRYARSRQAPRLGLPSASASTSWHPNSAHAAHRATTVSATIPIGGGTAERTCPRFPPLRLLGRLPPEHLAAARSARRPRTLNIPGHAALSRPQCCRENPSIESLSDRHHAEHRRDEDPGGVHIALGHCRRPCLQPLEVPLLIGSSVGAGSILSQTLMPPGGRYMTGITELL